MSKIYLSIDLDYWGPLKTLPARFITQVREHFKGPIALVDSHEDLLPHINRTNANKLINIDAHSDFPSMEISSGRVDLPVLEDGTWAEHVRWKAQSHFEWWRPTFPLGYMYGDCSGNDGAVALSQLKHGWRKASVRRGVGRIAWVDVVAVGVALSRTWCQRAGLWRQRSDEAHREHSLKLQAFLDEVPTLLAPTFNPSLKNT